MATNKEPKDIEETTKSSEKIPEIPKEVKEKLEKLKAKLDSFKNKVIKDPEKRIIGISLLPPEKENKNNINVLVVINSDNIKDPLALMEKEIKFIEKIADDTDKNIKPRIMSLYDLREACFDSKYEILNMIAMSAIIYDPTDVLAALKIAEIHKTMSLKKFEKYIVSYVAAGSLFRGEKSNDIDVYIIVDDTDVKKMPRVELKDKLRAIILSMGDQAAEMTGIKKQFHVQTYILTDFWDSIKDAHPVIFTLLRDGIPLYDRGVFMPWKLLLRMGKVKPSREAIEMQMDVSEKLLERTRYKLLSVVGEDLYYAILNPAQALLMVYGLTPPTPKETIELMDKIFVKEERLLDKKYVDILEKVRKYYKDIEHGKVKSISGKEIDELLNDAEDFLKKIKEIFEKIQKKKDVENIKETYEGCIKITKEMLEVNNIKFTESNILTAFKQLVDKEKLPERLFEILKDITKMEKEFKENKLAGQEIEKLGRDARVYLKTCIEYLQRKNMMELSKSKPK
ncbi:MAG: HEPN domain-containing protein [Candidatus Nanoarchaeia archaeon]|nr:HEPN domain-containing protein [Candidatus Nanoarchaeia archaeon]MDD5588053.1 HEPN domain-containing protein [Candidatus Nanoarchaeia archaeon]